MGHTNKELCHPLHILSPLMCTYIIFSWDLEISGPRRKTPSWEISLVCRRLLSFSWSPISFGPNRMFNICQPQSWLLWQNVWQMSRGQRGLDPVTRAVQQCPSLQGYFKPTTWLLAYLSPTLSWTCVYLGSRFGNCLLQIVIFGLLYQGYGWNMNRWKATRGTR